MFFRRLCYLPALIIVCSSCQNSSSKDKLIQSLQQSMERSSRTIENMSRITMAELKEKSIDPLTSYKGEIWLAKAEMLERYTNEFNDDIEKMIALPVDYSREKFTESKIALGKKLSAYADSVLAIDPSIRRELGAEFSDTISPKYFSPSLWDPLRSLDDANEQDRTVLLTQLKLGITERNNGVLSFCNEQIPKSPGFRFRISSVIVNQNSQAIIPGEKLEIIAGVGSYSMAAQPKVNINGSPCPVTSEGTAKYTLKPTGKPGTYHIPVVMDFIDEDGRQRTVKKDVIFRLLKAEEGSSQ